MSKNYEDLSRRGLIRLGKDYDKASGGELQDFLNTHEDEYENIRPIETVVQCTDRFVETISNSSIIAKKSVDVAANAAINKAADIVMKKADKAVSSAGKAIVSKLIL